MKNVLIWGAGVWGRKAFDILSPYKDAYHIVAFGDNDSNKIGKMFCNRPVWGIDMLEQDKQINLIIIAAFAAKMAEEIRKQLEKVVLIPIYAYDDIVNQLLLPRISIDISGFCNAKCKWCVTGRKNRRGKSTGKKEFMSFDFFKQLYDHLIEETIIMHDTEIMLYSWGEPLLNPDYIRIIEYLAEKRQVFSVSTNASVAPLAKKTDTYRDCVAFTFSMSGFSQQSYDRIHQLRFEKVKENVKRLVDNMYSCGFHGDGSLSWHVYRFNMHEMPAAREFAKSLNLRFNAYYPYFNGLSLTQEYMEGKLADEQDDIESDFIFDHVDGLLKERPEDYPCYLEHVISIDHKGRIVLCCASDEECRDFVWKPVGSQEELWMLRKQMMQCGTCRMCRKLHFDYWIVNNPRFGDA